jgi:alcohol dehydrogenase class IV
MNNMQKSFMETGGLSNLIGIVNTHGAKKVLIVAGKESFALSGAQEKIKKILNNIEIFIFNDFESNPKIKDVIKGIKLVRLKKPDLIVSIGGGSVIDMSKLIRILTPQGDDDYLNYINNPNKLTDKGLPLVAVPTTFGSGSEATHFAVVYIDNKKYSLAHHSVKPDYSIIDAELCYSLPHYASASCGMDALSQAVESYWSIKSTDESKEYAMEAISLINSALYDAVCGDKKARCIMLKAANLAGKAINISTTTAPHAISYPLSIFFGIPHGHAVSIILGSFFVVNSNYKDYKVSDPRGIDHLKETMNNLFDIFGVKDAYQCKENWECLMKKIGLTINLNELGITSNDDKQLILDHINIQRLSNNPVEITNDILSKVLIID